VDPVKISGPVLLLMGPIGCFFSRFSTYLESQGVPVYKLSFPLHEFGFESHQRINFSEPMEKFGPFLKQTLLDKDIHHIFMYGDFIDPHKIALDVVQELRPLRSIDAWVFELGYIRPNYVSLELERANARSNLNKSAEFYHALPEVNVIPQARRENGIRWRKLWKIPTFIQHSFATYRIIQHEHKLQPSPAYLLAQVRGFYRKTIYKVTELSVRKKLKETAPFFLVPLQVSSDSQVLLSSDYSGMELFIEDVISSFARHALPGNRLFFKHHPRDRGYNHYGRLIRRTAKRHQVQSRVYYYHDGPLGPVLKRAKGVITINSTVGLQALYHATPVKVMGKTFYDLPGLTDQHDLDQFWTVQANSDRKLFRKFYLYLLRSTQINGNFDGQFPFGTSFEIAPNLSIAASGQSPSISVVCVRITQLFYAVILYYLQLILLAFGRCSRARRLLEQSARVGLSGLGVRVLMDRRA
jgi:capsular polysaccharide export protein